MTRRSRAPLTVLVVVALVAAGCSDDSGSEGADATTTTANEPTRTSTEPEEELVPILLNGQGNDLAAYETVEPFVKQVVITNAEDDPDEGLDINAQICLWNDDDTTYFVAGEDTGQDEGESQGWGIFELEGDRVGELEASQVGKLVPTFQEGGQPENYGCGLLSDGRIVTTDIGEQALGPGTGQLIIWFPPFDSYEVAYCKLDVEIGTAQQIWVDGDDNVYVASARASSGERPAGVYRYSPPFPTSDDADGGCGRTDATDAPFADEVDRDVFVPAGEQGLGTPSGITPAPDGGFYVSSVFTGVINEYDASGGFVRTILRPPEGEELTAEESYSTGTPLGLATGPEGTLYYADIGIVAGGTDEEGQPGLPGPGELTGSVRRITFTDGEPDGPEVMDEDLAFPDGLGLWVPTAASSGGTPVP